MSKTMIRVNKRAGYVTIDKTGLNDNKLSWKAKGLLCYLLSLPDDWQIFQEELTKHAKDGLDSTRATIKELMKNGYITRTRERNEKGQLKEYCYNVFEIPVETLSSIENKDFEPKGENPMLGNPMLGNPTLGNPTLGNPTLLNNNFTKEITKLNNDFTKEITKLNNNQSVRKEEADRQAEALELIYKVSQVDLYPPDVADFVKDTIADIYISPEFAIKSRLSHEAVKGKLHKLTIEAIDRALFKFQQEREVKAPLPYFRKVLWNNLVESKLSTFNLMGEFDEVTP